MANPLYQMLMGQGSGQQAMSMPQASGGPRFANPMQKVNYILQAMRNPAAFIRQNIPGIPEQAYNDPTGNGVLQYMMQNMGVTQQDVQRVYSQIPQL